MLAGIRKRSQQCVVAVRGRGFASGEEAGEGEVKGGTFFFSFFSPSCVVVIIPFAACR